MINKVRYGLNFLATPIHYLANVPADITGWLKGVATSRESLEEENERLKQQNLLLQRRVQKMIALASENVRLRELLNSSALVEDSVVVAEIIGLDPDPFRHEIIINKGSRGGIQEGQPVLDSTGLMGQIIEVGPLTSRALLITDSNHATPVQVNRNGIRAILVGSGSLSKLHVIHVPDTADLKIGDILVSSGLGGRFPYGYPVAEVSRIEHDPGQPFAIVEAKPLSKLDRARHILVVFNNEGDVRFELPESTENNGAENDANGEVSDDG